MKQHGIGYTMTKDEIGLTGTLAELGVGVGDVVAIGGSNAVCIDVELSVGIFGYTHLMQMENKDILWCGGVYDTDKWRIVSRASTGPVITETVTRKRIVAGVYDGVSVKTGGSDAIGVAIVGDMVSDSNAIIGH